MAPKKKRPSYRLPAKDEIDAGCYIDFEGFARNQYQRFPPPVFIGVLRNGVFSQHVFTEAYRRAAEDADVDHQVIFEPDRTSFLKDLVNLTGMVKPIFAYSEHEQTIIEHLVGHKITKRYQNVRGIAQRWFNKQDGFYEQSKSNKLVDVVKAFGIPIPAKLEKGGVTGRLRNVREFSISKKKWDKAPSSVHDDWHHVLEHNRSDVLILPQILLRMHDLVS